jgi:small subunit ribosomal protein S4
MARYTGPKCKLCRRAGIKLFLKGERCYTPKCQLDPNRRPFPPGEHGQRRRKLSEYAVRLIEKQKARHTYGILERQFRKHFEEAQRRPGATGENFLQILETRLDNVVYRLGFADSRAQARQIVRHGHIELNGRKTDIPSALVRPGDVIRVRETSRRRPYFQQLAEGLHRRHVPAWLQLDPEAMAGRVLSLPTRADIDTDVNEQLIVEYYSR